MRCMLADVSYVGSDGVGGVGDCPRLIPTRKRPPGDLRATTRQDSTDAAVMVGPSISRIKKILFSAPSTCPIDLFGPLANGKILKRLHVDFCLLVSYMPLARRRALLYCGPRPCEGLEVRVALDLSSCEQQPSLSERCGMSYGDLYHRFQVLIVLSQPTTLSRDRTSRLTVQSCYGA